MGHHLDSNTSLFLSVEIRLKSLATKFRLPALECEDCIQEAWLALLRAHPDWELHESRTIAWLLAVARNKMRDFYRDLKRHQSQNVDTLDFVPLNSPSVRADLETDQDCQVREILSELQDRLDRLNDVNREILILRVQQGLTYREIAAVVGLEPPQVKARCHRALLSLGRAMDARVRGLVRYRRRGA